MFKETIIKEGFCESEWSSWSQFEKGPGFFQSTSSLFKIYLLFYEISSID